MQIDQLRDRITQLRRAHKPRWARVAAWITLGFTVTPVLVAIVLLVLLNQQGFRDYLRHQVEAAATEHLGVRVQLQNFAVHLQTLSVDLYGLTVDGADPVATPPLLQVSHIEAGVRVVSILRKAWYFDTLRFDHPAIYLLVSAQGKSNIPALKSGNGNAPTIFDLGIRHVSINNGEVYYNNRLSNLAVDLRYVMLLAAFNSQLQQYSGRLSYSNGCLDYGGFQPLAHNLDVQFLATPDTLHVISGKLTAGASRLAVSATMRDYKNPQIGAYYEVTIDGGQFATLFHNSLLPSGTVRTSGSLQYRQASNRSVIEEFSAEGEIASERLSLRSRTVRGEFANIAGHYSLANGNLTLRNLQAATLGGAIRAAGTMKNLGGESHTDLKATMRGISLAAATRASANSPLAGVGIDGVLNADATVSWGKTVDDLVAQWDATITARAAGSSAQRPEESDLGRNIVPSAVPIDGTIHGMYSARTHQLALGNSNFRTPQSSLTMHGMVSSHSNLKVDLHTGDLRELDALSSIFRPRPFNQPIRPLGLAGAATFQGNVQGSTIAPRLVGQLTASDLQIMGSAWKSLRAFLDVSPSYAVAQHAYFELAAGGRITLSASAALSNWSLTNASQSQIELQTSHLNIGKLFKLVSPEIPVTGSLDATLSARGTELSPIGNGNFSLTGATAYAQPIHAARLVFSSDGRQISGTVSAGLLAGEFRAKGSVNLKQRTFSADASANGLQLDQLQAARVKNINLSGALDLNATGHGSFDNPQLNATIAIPALAIQSQSLAGFRMQMALIGKRLDATLQSAAANTSIHAWTRIDLTGDYLVDASLDTQAIQLQPLLSIYAPDEAAHVTGQTELHATIQGPLKRTNLLEAHVSIPVFRAAYDNSVQLATASPIRADYKNGVLSIQRSAIRGTDTDLQFQGSIPTYGDGPMSLYLAGTINLQLAQLLDPDVRSSGQLRFNIDSHGPAMGTNLGGQIEIVDANFALVDLPGGLEHGKGVLTLTKNRVNIRSFGGVIGGGTLTAQGGFTFRPAIQFDLGMAAKGARILYPQGMRESVDANLKLTGSPDNALLAGAVDLSELSFTQAFDLTSFVKQFAGGAQTPPAQGFAQNLQLNLAVHSSNNVSLVSKALSIDGSANLQVRGTAAEPVILGRVNLNDGDIIFSGNRFVLNGGTIQFINPSQTRPVVNLSLNTTIQQYNINLRFNGPVEQMRTEYSSDPALPSADIINLLALGKTAEASNAAATSTNQAAESLIASGVSSQVTSRISKVAGISQLSISPVLAATSSQGPPGATITIQQRVTGNLFVNFSTNVASTQSQTIQGQYRVSPRVSLSATRDPNGGFAFDTLITKSW